MKIFILKLKSEVRITVDWVKKTLKKGHEITTFSLAEYNKYAPYATVKIIKVNSNKLLKLIKKELKKLDGQEIELADSKIGKDEADKRYDAEIERRLQNTLEQISECKTLDELAEFDYSKENLQEAIDKKSKELGWESEEDDEPNKEDKKFPILTEDGTEIWFKLMTWDGEIIKTEVSEDYEQIEVEGKLVWKLKDSEANTINPNLIEETIEKIKTCETLEKLNEFNYENEDLKEAIDARKIELGNSEEDPFKD